ncbi:hypothetical protein [Streptomyces sp. NRRL S-118]|uniref:hypothetical protein n=1 Tax=Streptomyces sp. NRRL S-118 TaxID=1463881 RepID=UPI000693C8F5|nr:hypothetical protein [Streptomyces sp. NRRL S-118]
MLKFREEKRTRPATRTIGGVSHDYEETYRVRIPVLPRDMDALAIRAASGLVLALTAVAIVWSTVSIGALLGGGVGFAAAILFDLSWLVNILLEWLSRFDPKKRAFSTWMGWGLLLVTMGAILWHGLLAGSVALAVIGAAVSMVAKVLWMGIMRFVHKDLSAADQQWVAAEISKANAQLAIAGVRRQAAAAEARARLEILAAERTLHELDELTERPADTSEPEVELVDAEPVAVPLASANTVRTLPEAGVSIAELARKQLTAGAEPKAAAAEILRMLPDANPESVAATVRRESKRLRNGYL